MKVFEVKLLGLKAKPLAKWFLIPAMTGYQEILTDPSYEGQLVAMTYPQIGNVGINPEDVESRRPFMKGFIVKDYTAQPSNWRATQPLHEYMRATGIVGIHGIDTRSLVRYLRDHGSRGRALFRHRVTTVMNWSPRLKLRRARSARTWSATSSCAEAYEWNQGMWELAGGYKQREPKKSGSRR